MPQYNRKQRRAAAAADKNDTFDQSSIPLERPRAQPRPAKTLLEIAAERQSELDQFVDKKNNNNKADNNNKKGNNSLFDLNATETQFLEVLPSGDISSFDPDNKDDNKKQKDAKRNKDKEDDGEEEEEGFPPIFDTLLLSIPLTTVHLTLAFLAAHQYVQEIVFQNLLRESLLVAFPVLTFTIHFTHGHIISFEFPRRKKKKSSSSSSSSSSSKDKNTKGQPKQKQQQQKTVTTALIGDLYTGKTLFYLSLAIVLGGWLVHTTNEAGYYAVMKRTPSIGTMWVWCVLEISSPVAALLALLMPLAWGSAVMGYSIFS